MQRALVLVALSTPILVHGPSVLHAAGLASKPGGKAAPEIVALKTADGEALQASYYKPDSIAPGVLLVHDAGGDRTQLDPLADRLSKQGFGVLTVDLRGHGGSKTAKLDWSKLSENDRKATWALAPKDLDAAAQWLGSQPTIVSTSLTLVGYGAGCALAVRHAKGDENVVCMVLLAPNAADYGFDVRADIQTLVGLPTFVATPKDDEAEKMALEANAFSGNPYLDIFVTPPKVATPLEDKNLPGKILKWVSEKAMPKKGRASATSRILR
jgi:dienelactone hydrolase